MSLRADEVARYLQGNPQFFEEYSQLIAQILIPHPHGGRAISITERQMLSLRNRNRELESKLSELIEFGEENDGISEKVHRLALVLAGAAEWRVVFDALHTHLADDFGVPLTVLNLWDAPEGVNGGLPVFVHVDEALEAVAESIAHPYCGGVTAVDPALWFAGRGDAVRSQALIPLRAAERSVGLLALGSEDPKRFYEEMGTLYLERLGELVAVALARTLGR